MCSYNTDICRICTKNDRALNYIFSSTSTISSISTAIMECAPITISDTDTLPHTICTCCLDKLEIAYNFRMLCIQTDQTLRNNVPCRIVKQEKDEKLPITSITEITSVLEDADMKGEEISYDNFPSSNQHISSEDHRDSDSGNDNDNDNGNDNDNHSHNGNDNDSDDDDDDDNDNYNSDSTFSIDSNELSDASYDSTKRPKKPIFGPPNCSLVLNEDGYFHCDQCEKKYKHKFDLQTHLNVHSNIRYPCEQCGKEFYRKQYLQRHMVMHETERKYNCEYCGMTFKQSRAFTAHRTLHLNTHQFKCDMCPKEFRLKRFLDNHRRSHTGERPFVCGVCGKSYKRKDHLTVHEQTHTGKRFKCTYCEQLFLTKRSVDRHMLRRSCRKLS